MGEFGELVKMVTKYGNSCWGRGGLEIVCEIVHLFHHFTTFSPIDLNI